METILLLAPANVDGSLGKNAMEAAGAAKQLADALGGAKLILGMFGVKCSAPGGLGFEKALKIEDPSLAQPRYSSDAAACAALITASGATLVLVPADSRMQRVAAGVAARIGGVVDTHVTELAAEGGQAVATRWLYRQRISAQLKRQARPWILTIEAGNFSAPAVSGSMAEDRIAHAAPASRSKVAGLRSPHSGPQTIRPDAALLFVAGAGWCKKQADGQLKVADAEKLILGFLDRTQASLGGSKSVVDQQGEGASLGFMSHMNQVGQTGSTPRHGKGLSTCCHGEEPHVVGWRFIQERRAVNLNANCGWAQGKADVVYVGDAFAVMDRLNQLLA